MLTLEYLRILPDGLAVLGILGLDEPILLYPGEHIATVRTRSESRLVKIGTDGVPRTIMVESKRRRA